MPRHAAWEDHGHAEHGVYGVCLIIMFEARTANSQYSGAM